MSLGSKSEIEISPFKGSAIETEIPPPFKGSMLEIEIPPFKEEGSSYANGVDCETPSEGLSES